MEIKNYLNPGEMIMFVNSVIDMCKQNGEFEPAIYDYAFRINTIIFFTDKELPQDQESLTQIAYSDECNALMFDETPRKYVIIGLNKACREKIKIEQERMLYIYNSAAISAPFNKFAKGAVDLFDSIKSAMDTEKIMEAVINAQDIKQKEKENGELLYDETTRK